MTRELSDIVSWLRTTDAVRERCGALYTLAQQDALKHFRLREDKLDGASKVVAQTIRKNYPDLSIPYHSRWRHFESARVNRWETLAQDADLTGDERARCAIDLCVTSVLLDAGAGATWAYREPATGLRLGRSEGLAIASFDMFAAGAFSANAKQHPLRADSEALERFDATMLSHGFQVTNSNHLHGLAGRAALIANLGKCIKGNTNVFGEPARIGNLYDHLKAQATNGSIKAHSVLSAVLEAFADIWPGRISLGGANLGDVWRHCDVTTDDESNQLVPFHKLSQWLTYSLLEPLEQSGLVIEGIDELTGLAEYRNGGLFIDTGVLEEKHSEVTSSAHPPESEIIIEWRALTVALLDRIAVAVRRDLDVDANTLPLAKILEGGTWSAGRALAKERRPNAAPPITIVSDGTVF